MVKDILLVGWNYPPDIDGGLDLHVYHLFQELRKSDELNVDLALPVENAPDLEGVLPIETGEGSMLWRSREMSRRIAKMEGYDIIHTHDWFGAEAGFKASKYSDIDWVSTMHSLSSSRTRGGSEQIENLEEVAVKESDFLITVSRKLKNEIVSMYGREASVVYNGFSKPEASGKNIKDAYSLGDSFVFFVGRHSEQKGIEHLLYGFKKFLDKDFDTKLVVGGEGYLNDSLKKFAELLDIEDKVVFTGFIPFNELGDFYREAEVFVSPSINEPFGLTITEALETGTKVVATESGVNEILETNSLIRVRPDSDSIAEGLIKAFKSDDSPNIKSRTWKNMADDIIEVYNGF